VRLAAVYSSPLSRARLTAEAIAEPHGLDVIPLNELREIRLGVWEGLTESEVSARFAEVFYARRRDPERVAPEGGETLADLGARGLRAVHRIVACHPEEAVAAIAHGAINKAILLSVLHAPLRSYWRIRQDNAAINILDFDGDRARVTLLNETAHLDGLSRPM
jgi:probable phosphoglycerate mutase